MNIFESYGHMAISMADERSLVREPTKLAHPPVLRNSIIALMRRVLSLLRDSMSWASREAAYCTLNPSACGTLG